MSTEIKKQSEVTANDKYLISKYIDAVPKQFSTFLTNNAKDASKIGDFALDTFSRLAPYFNAIAWLPEHKIFINIAYKISNFKNDFKILAPLTSLLECISKTLKLIQATVFSEQAYNERISKKPQYYTVFYKTTQHAEDTKILEQEKTIIKTDLKIRKLINLVISFTFLFFAFTDLMGWLSSTQIYIHPYPLFIPVIGGALLSAGSALAIMKSRFKINQIYSKLNNVYQEKNKEIKNTQNNKITPEQQIAKKDNKQQLEIKKIHLNIASQFASIIKSTMFVAIGLIVAFGLYFNFIKHPYCSFALFTLSLIAIAPIITQIFIDMTKKIYELKYEQS